MIIFTKKIKTKEGINTIDLEKAKKEIPAGYKATGAPQVSYTANHVVLAFVCELLEKAPEAKKAAASKSADKKIVKTKAKKIIAG